MRRVLWEDIPPAVRDPKSECLRWQGRHHSRGYGMLGSKSYAHRVAWEREHGPIPEGLTVDHVLARGCVWRDCIEVAHMELVPQSVNTARSRRSIEQRGRTHCPQDHEYTPENTIIKIRNGREKRDCRACAYVRNSARHAANRDEINARRRADYAAGKVAS